MRQPLTCWPGWVATASSLRNREPGAAVAAIRNHPYPGLAQSVEDAVLAGSAHVVAGTRQRGRGPDQPAGRVRDHLHVHPMALVFPGVERPVPTRGHPDPVDAQQRPVHDHGRSRMPSDRRRTPCRATSAPAQPGHREPRGYSGTPWSCRPRNPRPGQHRSRPLRRCAITSRACRPAESRRHRVPTTERRCRSASDTAMRAWLDTVIPAG